ncbi:hypothetical protein [Streptomyces erythrochromogenes]
MLFHLSLCEDAERAAPSGRTARVSAAVPGWSTDEHWMRAGHVLK